MSLLHVPTLNAVHIDLKGVVFRPSYIPQLLDDLADQKVNAVLVEYEDIFPFRGIDLAYDKSVVWSPKTLQKFTAHAAKVGIEVIPLQQCLGHLEYALGWDKYRKLSEHREYPSTFRLRDKKARKFLFELLAQMLDAHPESKYIHLGMDEAHGLNDASKRLKTSALDLYLEHLEAILDFIKPWGKTPMVWSDMLEDRFRSDALLPFKDRMIMCTWDYDSTQPRSKKVRLSGFHVSKKWLAEPQNPAAPAIHSKQTFIEDLPADVQATLAPHLHEREVQTLFQVDLWTKLGFRVATTSGLRVSSQGPILPDFNRMLANVQQHSLAVHRNRQFGQIGSSWARGTSWCPPNYPIDLTWPMIGEMSRSMGFEPPPFWPGVPSETIEQLVRTIGRTKLDWRMEDAILAQMGELSPKISAHQYEWESLRLMVEVLKLQRQVDYAILEVEYFDPNHRPVDSEWERRLADQAKALKDQARIKSKVRKHFAKRYHGAAFEEWISELFDLANRKLKACQAESRRKLKLARKRFASR